MSTVVADRSILITGASKGIGRGIARVLAQYGAKVTVVSRSIEGSEAVAQEIQDAGGTALPLAADVSDLASMQAAAGAARDAFGGIDVLCANAGVFPSAALGDITEQEWDTVMNTNLKGTLFSVQACLPALRISAAPRIVLTSSITGPITGYPGWAHYGASKAGQLGFLRTAAIELAKDGITVNAVLPGNILTEGLEGLGEEYLQKMASAIPMQRLGTVEDIAHGVLYFASPHAAYVTGQTLVIDGGQVLPE
jgi:3-oxoacyl-[acyl-carrier protein] reductase